MPPRKVCLTGTRLAASAGGGVPKWSPTLDAALAGAQRGVWGGAGRAGAPGTAERGWRLDGAGAGPCPPTGRGERPGEQHCLHWGLARPGTRGAAAWPHRAGHGASAAVSGLFPCLERWAVTAQALTGLLLRLQGEAERGSPPPPPAPSLTEPHLRPSRSPREEQGPGGPLGSVFRDPPALRVCTCAPPHARRRGSDRPHASGGNPPAAGGGQEGPPLSAGSESHVGSHTMRAVETPRHLGHHDTPRPTIQPPPRSPAAGRR